MALIDQIIVFGYLIGALAIGIAVTRKASTSSEEYFLAGRSLPWWLAGTSIVATTFAADTPLAVTGLVASGGIAGNWIWWCWGIAHVVAAVVFARYWRRLRVVTDAEVMELRYAGTAAVVLRVTKTAYQAIFLNCLTMGWVILAMRKVSLNLFPDQNPVHMTFALMALAVTYSVLGGMRSVVLTDLVQFTLAMIGAALLLVFVLQSPEIGGISGLLTQLELTYPEKSESLLTFFPTGDLPDMPIFLFAVLMTVGWWRQAEGMGYIVQRIGATKSPRDAEQASIWFAVLHNAIRPWPWIVVALAALVIWPLGSVPDAGACTDAIISCPAGFSCADAVCVFDREATYATLLVDKLPPGALGIVLISLLAEFMSTIDTHVNWGASYLVRDIWQRFVSSEGNPKQEVLVGRIGVVCMALLAALLSLKMTSIVSVWVFLLTLGSGLGSVAIARWLWWRVNAISELAALLVSTALAIWVVYADIPRADGILWVAFGSLAVWLPLAIFGSPTPLERLDTFYQQARPAGFWGPVAQRNPEIDNTLEKGIGLRLLAGLVAVYGTLIGLGGLILRPERDGVWALVLLAGLKAFHWLLIRAKDEPE